MAKALKLYSVGTGFVDSDGEDIQNYSGKNVVAHSAEEAIRKVRRSLQRREYVESVKLVSSIDLA
jgi:hypothetical protein